MPAFRLGHTALALGLLGLGASLRLYGIGDHELWIDEYGTWWAVAGDGGGGVWERVLAVQGQSPLYYLLVRASVALGGGPSPLSLRLPSLLCGLGLLALAFPLGEALFRSRRAALGTLAVFAVNERLIYYSQEARPYALALLAASASFLLYLRLLRSPEDPRARAGYVLACAATWYAHYLFGVVLLIQALHLCLRRERLRPHLRAWLRTGGLVALALLPGLVHLVGIAGRRQALDWVPPAGPAEGLLIALRYLDPPILLATAGVAVLVSLRRGARPAWPDAQPGLGLLLLWLAVPFLVVALASPLLDVTLVHRRYLLAVVPAVGLLYGRLLALPARHPLLAWLPLVVFLCAVSGLRLLPRYEAGGVFSERYVAERWHRAARTLLAEHRPGEPILYDTRFVELDAVIRGSVSDATVEFTTWPVAAWLPPARRASLRALPYGDSPEMRRAVRARLDEAAAHPRAWVIGLEPGASRVLRRVRQRPDLEVIRRERFGRIHLLRLRGRGQ